MKRTTPIRPANIDVGSDPGLSTFSPRPLQPVILPTSNTTTGTASSEITHSVQIIKNIYTVNPPGGANGEVQFNLGGSYTGDGGLTYNPATDTLTTGTLYVTNLYPNNINFTSISNLSISGGSYNNVLKTDGAGTLTWASAFPSDAGNTGKFLKSNGVSQEWANVSYANLVDVPGNIATTSYVSNAIANLVNSAPGALDTLSELANALGNNASFSTTITNQLANKASVTYVDNRIANITYANLSGTPTIPTSITDLGITDGSSGQVLTAWGNGNYHFTTVSGGSSYDQDLNTTNNVTFNSVSTSYISSPNNIEIITEEGSESGIDLYTDWSGNGVEVWLQHNDRVSIKTENGTYEWSFNNVGNLVLPQADMLASPAPELSGIVFSDGTFQNTAAVNGGSTFDQDLNTTNDVLFNQVSIENDLIGNGSLNIYTNDTNDIDLYTNDYNGNAVEVWLQHDSGLLINTNNSDIETTYSWNFDKYGNLTFPDSTVQTTAWDGVKDRLVTTLKSVVLTDDGTLTLPGTGTLFDSKPLRPSLLNNYGTNYNSLSPFVGGGGSIQFSASSKNYITVPGSDVFAPGTNNFTIEWFQYQTAYVVDDNHPRIFSLGEFPHASIGVSLEGTSQGNQIFYFWSKGNNVGQFSTNAALNTWVHYAVVKGSGYVALYQNGVQKARFANTDNIINNSDVLWLGGEPNGPGDSWSHFNGYITNFRWSDTARYPTSSGYSFSSPTNPFTPDSNTQLLLLANDGGTFLVDSSLPLGSYNLAVTVNGNTWNFNDSGALQLPANGDIVDSFGTSVLGGQSFDQDLNTTDDVQFSSVSTGNIFNTETIEITTPYGTVADIDIYTDWAGNGSTGGIDLWLKHGDALYIKTHDGAHVWSFDDNGILNLPASGDIRDSSGNSVLGGGSGNPFDQSLNTTDSPRFDDIEIHGNIIANSSIDVYSVNGGEIDIYTDWESGNGVEVWLKHDDGIHLTTQNGQFVWQFNKDGSLTLPTFSNDWTACTTPTLSGGLTFATNSEDEGAHGTTRYANVNLDRNSLLLSVYNGNSSSWRFNEDGNLTAPGNITANTFISNDFNVLQAGNLKITSQYGLGFTGTILEDNGDLEVYGSGGGGAIVGWTNDYNTLGNVATINFNTVDSPGNILVRTGNRAATEYNWEFNNTGVLTIPGGGEINNEGNENTVNIVASNYVQIQSSDTYIWVEQNEATVDVDGTQWSFKNPTVAGAVSNAFEFPNGVTQRSGDFVNCDSNEDTVIYTSSDQYMHTLKLLLCIEGVEDGQSQFDTQSCEMIVAKSHRGNNVIGSAYGLVYTSVNPLVTLSTRWNGVANRIEVVCRPVSTMNGVYVHVTCTELATSQI